MKRRRYLKSNRCDKYNTPIKGYIGRSNIPVSGFLGNILIAADNAHVPHKKYKISKAGYRHRYTRNTTTYMRTLKACEILRFHYRYSMNNIALGLQISTRTVKNRLKDLNKMGFKIFHCMRNKIWRSKNSAMKHKLMTIGARIQSYIDGRLTLLELYARLGIKPPPHGAVQHSLFFLTFSPIMIVL